MLVRQFLNRVVPAAALAALIVTAVTVTPSIANSFLNDEQAAKVFVKKKVADKRYVRTRKARKTLLTRKVARRDYLAKADLPTQPVAALSSSTVPFSASSTTPEVIELATTGFTLEADSFVTLTFSGQSTCTALTDGVGCPLQIRLDGTATGRDKTNFGVSSSADPAPAPEARTVVQTAVLGPGDHVATVQYAGSANPSLQFGLTDWNFIVEAYPIP